jgi:hypothetical protein
MPFARKNDPLTSHEAAESVVAVSETQKVILDLLSGKPMCDQELNERYQMRWASGLAPAASESGVRSRRHELAVRGLLRVVGETRTIANRRALVWATKGETK